MDSYMINEMRMDIRSRIEYLWCLNVSNEVEVLNDVVDEVVLNEVEVLNEVVNDVEVENDEVEVVVRRGVRSVIGGRSPLARLGNNKRKNKVSKPKIKTKRSYLCERSGNASIECAICLDSHSKFESIKTECGHLFGKECYTQWMKSKGNKTCPSCRHACKCVTIFKVRSPVKVVS